MQKQQHLKGSASGKPDTTGEAYFDDIRLKSGRYAARGQKFHTGERTQHHEANITPAHMPTNNLPLLLCSLGCIMSVQQ